MKAMLLQLRRALFSADTFAAAGIACLGVGAWMAWPPAGFLVVGAVLILVARTEAK